MTQLKKKEKCQSSHEKEPKRAFHPEILLSLLMTGTKFQTKVIASIRVSAK